MSTVHMLIGIPGSGKSTYCNRNLLVKYPDAVLIASDKVRDANPNMPEENVFPTVYKMSAEALNQGKDIIFDATSITPGVREHFVNKVKEFGANSFDMIAYYFITDPRKCVNRVTLRNKDPHERFLPTEIIEGYGQRIIPPTLNEGFKEIITIDNNKDWDK